MNTIVEKENSNKFHLQYIFGNSAICFHNSKKRKNDFYFVTDNGVISKIPVNSPSWGKLSPK